MPLPVIKSRRGGKVLGVGVAFKVRSSTLSSANDDWQWQCRAGTVKYVHVTQIMYI